MLLLSLLPGIVLGLLQVQPQTNFDRVIRRPDPSNGYDDYVRATDFVNTPELDACLSWSPEQLDEMLAAKRAALTHPADPKLGWGPADEAKLGVARRLHDLDFLGVQRDIEDRMGGAMNLIRAGNLKNVWDPREKTDVQSTYPELSGFRRLAKLIRAEAYARFADGDTKNGTSALLDGLTFSRRIGGGNVLSELVASADQAVIFAGFEEHLAQLSDQDAAQISKYCDAALSEPVSYLHSLQRERNEILASIDFVLDTPGDYLAANPSQPTSSESALIGYLKGLSPGERQTVKNDLGQTLGDTYNQLIGQIGSDESSWLDASPDSMPPDPVSIATPVDAADALLHALVPSFDRVTVVVERTRTQLRLLDLHGRIIDFKWRNNRLPADLKEAVPGTFVVDPLSKSTFQYVLKDSGYRLFSKGAASTGIVELRYTRPANLPGQDPGGIPPPIWLGR